MSGWLIESKPLTGEQAYAVVELLSKSTITGALAGEFLAAVLALKRIADGVDKVTPEE